MTTIESITFTVLIVIPLGIGAGFALLMAGLQLYTNIRYFYRQLKNND